MGDPMAPSERGEQRGGGSARLIREHVRRSGRASPSDNSNEQAGALERENTATGWLNDQSWLRPEGLHWEGRGDQRLETIFSRGICPPSVMKRRGTKRPVTSSGEDALLIKAFQKGDKRAFDQLAIRHKDIIFNLCYRFLGDLRRSQ